MYQMTIRCTRRERKRKHKRANGVFNSGSMSGLAASAGHGLKSPTSILFACCIMMSVLPAVLATENGLVV